MPAAGAPGPWPGQVYGWAPPSRPARPRIRPVGGYGDYVWWFYRHHGLRLVALALVTSIPSLIVGIPTYLVTAEVFRRQQDLLFAPFSGTPDPGVLRALDEINRPLMAIGAIAGLVATLSFLAAGAAIAWYVREVEAGRGASIGGALDAVADRLGPLLGLWAILGVLSLLGQAFGAATGTGGLILLDDPALGSLLLLAGIVGFLAWLAIGLVLAVRWSLAVSALTLDGLGTRDALARSWRWTDGNSWRIFGLLALAVLAALLVAAVPIGLGTVLLFPASMGSNTALVVVAAVLNWVGTGLIVPIFSVLLARVYLDLRSQLATA